MTARLNRREALALMALAGSSGSSGFLGCSGETTRGAPRSGDVPRGTPRNSEEPRGTIITRPIPSSKEQLPIIGMGTWQTFDVGTSATERKPREEVLAEFVRLGGRVVDSSPMYGRSENVLGDVAVKLGLRDQLFVATKVWTSGSSAGVRQMRDSIAKLRGPVQLMQVHNLVDADAHLATLRQWKAQGTIRYIGITHYTAGAHDDLAAYIRRGGIDFVQVNYSLAEREAENGLLPLAQERGVAVLVNRPLGGGSLFRSTRGKPLPAFAKELDCTSWSELFLKFVVSHPAVTCAIPATSKIAHLRENMRAGTDPMPDAKLRQQIAAAI